MESPYYTVVLPEVTRAPMGARKPLARVLTNEGHEYSVPLSVGRALKSQAAVEATSMEGPEFLNHLTDLQREHAFKRLVKLLERRDYTVKEAKAKLELDGYWSEPIEFALTKAQALRILNDARYADGFIRSKVAAGWGAKRIELELERRGIEASAVPGWPSDYLSDDEYGRALALASRRPLTGRDPYAKVVRFLVSRGFSGDVAHRVASALTKDSRD